MEDEKWYTISIKKVVDILKTSENGLTDKEAERRLKHYGYNELVEKKHIDPLSIFLQQFKSFLIMILLIAVVISFLIGHITDGMIILVIVIVNAILGFVQEYRAEKAMEMLKKLVVPMARVIRNGKQTEIPAKELVPGDVILIEEGERIPADARLIEVASLKVDESTLTGESTTVTKTDAVLEHDVPLADRRNMVYTGTIVTYGRGKAIVVKTGMMTEIGKIAEKIQEEKEETTPLQRKLDQFSKWLGLVALIVCVMIFSIGILEKSNPFNMFLTAVALAVSAVPEGLPAVITITLALGMNRMAKKNALVRRLSAVETLGSASIICADKTGTMTTNEMTVRKLYCNDEFIEVTGVGFEPIGKFYKGKMSVDPNKEKSISLILKICNNCNNAELHLSDAENPEWSMLGDPTEIALLVLVKKAGVDNKNKITRIGEIPFSSERKMMSTIHIHKSSKAFMVYSKGAPETILKICDFYYKNNRVKKLSKSDRKRITDAIQKMASDGLRVLGMAYKKLKKLPDEKDDIEKNMIFIGLVGMMDPPRKEVKKAIKLCKQAGIKVIMITGDHKLTAVAIARELGILTNSESVLTGAELDNMNEDELERMVEKVKVYARVSPEHKVRILMALKKKGHVVAMTGDGINDAPALKKADIGIAMGIKGTDVTKEASDMILIDDNFATIVKAVEEGRGIYDNIRKFVRFLLSANFDEMMIISVALLMRFPLPILPIQILWLNLITDGLPALALTVDPKDPELMKRKPRDPKKGILDKTILFMITATIFGFLCSFTLFLLELRTTGNLDKARTLVFTSTILFELFFVFNCRSEKYSVFKVGVFENRLLLLAVIVSLVIQVTIIYVPLFQQIFHTVAIDIFDWMRVIVFSSLGLLVLPEIFMNKKQKFELLSKV